MLKIPSLIILSVLMTALGFSPVLAHPLQDQPEEREQKSAASEASAPAVSEKTETQDQEQTKEQDQEQESGKILQTIKKSMGEIQSMAADFSMINPNGRESSGRLYLKKPGYVRFDFGEKANQLYVSDGKVLSIIDYEIGKVEKVPVKDTPLKILLAKELDFKGLNTQLVTNPDGSGTVAVIVTDKKKEEMGELILYFKPVSPENTQNTNAANDSATGFMLDYWAIRDGQGAITYIILKNREINIPLKQSLWTFKDPRGSAKRRR